jgi:hypothetical protein
VKTVKTALPSSYIVGNVKRRFGLVVYCFAENSCLVRNPGPPSFRKRYCAHVTGNRTSALTHMTQASIRPCPNFENSSSSPLCDLSRVYWFHLCVYINPWEFRLRCNQTENFLAVIRLFFKMPSRRDHRVTINSEIAK